MKCSFFDLAVEILKKNSGKALSISEIWEFGKRNKIWEKLNSSGKTPINTLSTRLLEEARKTNAKIKRVSANPARYILTDDNISVEKIEECVERDEEKEESKKFKFLEADLHQLLVNFVRYDSHFHCYAKTISEKESKKGVKGSSEWLHPDIVGIQYSFDGFSEEILKLQGHLEESRTRLFSFELKRELSFANIREYYFQAVSNSSWANEGYLVALKISRENEFLQELRRLSNSFGIGVIKLNSQNVSDSEIICPAREHNIDWATIDVLCQRNRGFKTFIQDIDVAIPAKKIYESTYDKILDDEALADYIKKKNISE